ncbi:GPP34 family phosphoprotein [Bacillus sp. FSL K6-0047]
MPFIAEQLFLLAINPQTAKLYYRASTALPYALNGALLAELMINGNIELQHKKAVVVNENTNDPLLKQTLARMKEKKPRSLKYWVQGLSSSRTQQEVAALLEEQDQLTVRKTRFLGLFPSYEYHLERNDLHAHAYRLFRAVLDKMSSQEPLDREEERYAVLLAFLHTSKLLPLIFKKRAEVRKAAAHLKRISKDLPVSAEVKKTIVSIETAKTIDAVETAMIVAMTTIVVTSNSSNSS